MRVSMGGRGMSRLIVLLFLKLRIGVGKWEGRVGRGGFSYGLGLDVDRVWEAWALASTMMTRREGRNEIPRI